MPSQEKLGAALSQQRATFESDLAPLRAELATRRAAEFAAAQESQR